MPPRPPAPGAQGILALSAPLVISFWMRSMFTFVDTVFAATLGDSAVAAIGLSFPFEFAMIAIWVGLSAGLTSNLGRAIGTRAHAKVQQHLAVSGRLVWCCVPVFLLIGAGIYFYGGRWAPDARTGRQFEIYGSVLVGGSALTMFWSVIPDSIVKAHHDTRATMWAGIWSNLINLALNIVFTFVFHWGIFGIALSTVLGRFGGLIYAWRKAAAHEERRLALSTPLDSSLDPEPYRATLQVAIPSALAFCAMAIETALINGVLVRGADGSASIAAYAVFFRVQQFIAMPVIAAGVAMLPFAARRFAECDPGGLRKGLREATIASAAYLALAVPVLWWLTRPIGEALTEAPRAEELVRVTLPWAPLLALLSIPSILARPVFEAQGNGRPGLILAVTRHIVLLWPAAWIGVALAATVRRSALEGVLAGTLLASLLTSLAAWQWVLRTVQSSAPQTE
jgi:Na+-driven multidrug efflux pump